MKLWKNFSEGKWPSCSCSLSGVKSFWRKRQWATELTLNQRGQHWEVGQQETNSVFFCLSVVVFILQKKKYLGRYINTIFFITKDTNDSLILRMWCLRFFFLSLMIMWNLCWCRSFGIHACHVISGTELALVDTNLLSLEICEEIWLCLIKILSIECLIKEFIGFTVIKFQRLWRWVLDPFKQVSFHCTIAVNSCFGSSSFPQSVFLVREVHIDESLLASYCQMHDYCLKFIFSVRVTTWIQSRPKWLYRDVVQVYWKACRN